MVKKKRAFRNDVLKSKSQKEGNLNFLLAKNQDIKKTTDKIMKEIDE